MICIANSDQNIFIKARFPQSARNNREQHISNIARNL